MKQYKVVAQKVKNEEGGYTVDHSAGSICWTRKASSGCMKLMARRRPTLHLISGSCYAKLGVSLNPADMKAGIS